MVCGSNIQPADPLHVAYGVAGLLPLPNMTEAVLWSNTEGIWLHAEG